MSAGVDLLLELLAAAGTDMRETGGGCWRGNCPACGGGDRLVIGTGDLNGRAWVKCWSATCQPTDVLGVLGTSWADVNPNGDSAGESSAADVHAALFDEPLGLGDDGRPREQVPGGAELLYRGQAVTMFSERGAGKSSVATILGVSVAAHGGRVYYWDRENGRQLTGQRVAAILDAHDDWPDLHELGFVYREYPRLERTWSPQDVAAALDGFDVVVFDSLREAIAQLGGNPDAEADISHFVALCVTPIVSRGGAVLTLDNVGHEFTNRPRGSASKLDAIPQAFKVVAVQPFSAVQLGRIEIECTRSRFGDHGRIWEMGIGAGVWELPGARGENPDHKAAREIANHKRALLNSCTQALRVNQPQGAKALVEKAREAGLRKRAIVLKKWLEELAEDPASSLDRTPDGYVISDRQEEGPKGGSLP